MGRIPRRSLLAAASVAALLRPQPLRANREKKVAGSLVLCGGGRPYNDDVLDAFWQLAGGEKARIVVVPTAHPDMDSPAKVAGRIGLVSAPWTKRGAASVTVRHTLSPDEANSQEFAAPLTEATGVWLGGGDQSRLLAAYRDTLFHREMLALLKRGGVIGGSSAGTAVQSEVTIVGQRDQQTLVERGFNFLPGAVVDQHFIARSRQARLERVVRQHRSLVGMGVDEYTALIIHGNEFSVVGKSTVSVYRCNGSGDVASRVYRAGDKVEIEL
jgi:cyanophycinase